MNEQQRKKEEQLIQTCQQCMDGFFNRNPGTIFDYRRCERCQVGRENHNLERGSRWDSVPFATSKMGK